jgi:surface antigen
MRGVLGRAAIKGALGRAAVKPPAALVLLALLAGCASTGSTAASSAGPVSGALAGLGVSAVTADPFVGYAVGIGTQAAVTALEKYLARKLHQGEQDRIAATVANLQPGQSAPWQIHYDIPVDAAHGDVTVTREISNALTDCKEVAFTVIAGREPDAPRGIYLTTACRESDGTWQWAEAEPAAARWGFLQ